MMMAGAHDWLLVALSIGIAIFASFAALSLASRVRASRGWTRRVWLSAAAIALGGGIWSMHFIAMLAFHMPGMETSYDLPLTLLSLGIALAFTGAGFALMNWRAASRGPIVGAGLLMGLGVVTMHYVGMAAMRMPATLRYDPSWFALSVLIAIGAAIAALWLAQRDQKFGQRMAAACVMGAAIAGMHYSSMQGAIFTATGMVHGPDATNASFDRTFLASVIGAITTIILLMALGAARIERMLQGFARREARIALRLEVADVLRARTTIEALEEVARLTGAHFDATRTGYGQFDPAADAFDHEVCWTDGSARPLLGRYPIGSFGERTVAALRAGHTVAIEDLAHPVWAGETPRHKPDTRSMLVVPFVRDGELRTIVYLNDRNPRSWHREEIAFMEEIAERTRLVIERAAVEEKLRDLNATLEARVDARTRELREAQEALLQSQKMEAVGQLVSGLAHDFNNVLGAIVGGFDLIRRRADDADRVLHLADAGLQAAERGAKLTAQLLTFARSQRIQLQPLHVGAVIEALHDLLARTLGPMIRLEICLAPAALRVMADPTQLEMMLLNLAINARDAMPDGGRLSVRTALVHIGGEQEIADGDYVEIAVSDSGIGMDEATLRRAMEPFFTTKPVGKGTGLGLAQIYGSARQAGGTVRIDSAPGKGTTVRVLLPCTDREPVAAAPAAPAEGTSRGPICVLLVEDDEDLRDVLANALRGQGHRVIEASDGEVALARLEIEVPDVAVLDFAMPGMNGAELARRMGERWPELPVIFASGFADTDAIEAATGGKPVILQKPFRVEQLFKVLEGRL